MKGAGRAGSHKAEMPGKEGISTGIDCEAIDRFDALVKNKRFLKRVFTAREVEHCLCRRGAARLFAGRYAAKEACLKALGTGLAGGLSWQDLEVAPDGKSIKLSGTAMAMAGGKDCARLGITSGAGLAVAFVVIG